MADDEPQDPPKPKPITHEDVLKTLMSIINDCRRPDGTVFEYVGMTISAEQARHLYKAHQIVDADAILQNEKRKAKANRRGG